MPPPVDELRQIIYVLAALLTIAVGLALVHPPCTDPTCQHAHGLHRTKERAKEIEDRQRAATARHGFHSTHYPVRDCLRCTPQPPG